MKMSKKEIAFDETLVKDYVERLFRIENEIATLNEDKKELNEEFKSKVDLKLVGSAIKLIKLELKLNKTSETTLEEVKNIVLDKINIIMS